MPLRQLAGTASWLPSPIQARRARDVRPAKVRGEARAVAWQKATASPRGGARSRRASSRRACRCPADRGTGRAAARLPVASVAC